MYYNFNPHPYVRDDVVRRRLLEQRSYFNPHPYVRDDGVRYAPCLRIEDFNPHPYVRDDCDTAKMLGLPEKFQSTSLREG